MILNFIHLLIYFYIYLFIQLNFIPLQFIEN